MRDFIFFPEALGETGSLQTEKLANFLGSMCQEGLEKGSDSVPLLQVVGLPGFGKTTLVQTFVTASGIPHAYVDCALAGGLLNGVSGPVVDVIFNGTLRKLAQSLESVFTFRSNDRKAKNDSVLELLELWTRDVLQCQLSKSKKNSEYGKRPCALFPTPVLVFDNAHVLKARYPHVLRQLTALPQSMPSATNVGEELRECRCVDITVIFVASAPVISHDYPTLMLRAYGKQGREVVLKRLFKKVGWPTAEAIAGRVQDVCGAGVQGHVDRECAKELQRECSSTTIAALEDCAWNDGSDNHQFLEDTIILESSTDYASSETSEAVSVDVTVETETVEVELEMDGDSCDAAVTNTSDASGGKKHLTEEGERYVPMTRGVSGVSGEHSTILVACIPGGVLSDKIEEAKLWHAHLQNGKEIGTGDNADLIIWDSVDYIDGPLCIGSKMMVIHEQVVKEFWGIFVERLNPLLGRYASSDFHETLFLARRLWGVYILPLLQMDSTVIGHLSVGNLEAVFQELQKRLERHYLCIGLPALCYNRHLEPPSVSAAVYESVTALPSALPWPIAQKWLKNARQPRLAGPSAIGTPVAAIVSHQRELNYDQSFESPVLSLVLLLSAFLASATPPSRDRLLMLHVHQHAPGGSRKRQLMSDRAENIGSPDGTFPIASFPFFRWLFIARHLLAVLERPLCESHSLYNQVSGLLQVGFVRPSAGLGSECDGAFGSKSRSPLDVAGRLNGTARFICTAPIDVIEDVANRLDLPLHSLLPSGTT